MFPRVIEQLIEYFNEWPDMTKRQAARTAFFLIKEKKETIEALITLLRALKSELTICALCSHIAQKKSAEGGKVYCSICSQKNRNPRRIMVIEKVSELDRIERLKAYEGLYHLVGEGSIKEFARENNPHIAKLLARIHSLKKASATLPIEVILAFNPTREGELKMLYLKELLASQGVILSKMGRGIPAGGEIEYFDRETLKEALVRRSKI